MRRWFRRLTVTVIALVVVAVLLVGWLWVSTPSADSAPARLAALLAREPGARAQSTLPSPDRIGAAVIATEDSRFLSDPGVDLLGLTRGVLGPLVFGRDEGGSSLDQQLAKLIGVGDRGMIGRLRQTVYGAKIDSRFTKQEILRMYLDAAYFGHGYYGVWAASRGYFGRTPSTLTWSQASMLAGLVQAPSRYDPVVHLDRARRRQRHVLDRLVATHVLTAAQADAAFAGPLGLLRRG